MAALVFATVVPQFGPAHEVASSQPDVGLGTELEIGDVNGDGIPDAVITRLTYPPAHVTHPVGIFLGDGKGGFTDGSSMWDGSPPRTEWGRQILIADFNGDHRNDIFVADHGYDATPFPGHQNALALSTPQSKLVDATANLPAESGFSHSGAAADVDGDGDVDIFVGNYCCGDGTPPEILLNDGTGHFTRRTDLLPPQVVDNSRAHYTRALFMDVNGDNAPDLVLGGDTGTDSRVLLNDGHGHFSHGPPLPPKHFDITISFAAVEVNRDGRPDLLVGSTQQSPFYGGSFVQVLVNNGDGTFRDESAKRLPQQPTTQGWPYALRVADVNKDGRPDFGVALNGPNGELGLLYMNDGSGVFNRVQFQAANSFWAFVDANGDGYPDVFSFQSHAPDRETHFVQLQLVAPPAVTRLRAVRRASGVALSWSAAGGATGYEVWRSGKKLAAPAGRSFLDKTAKRGRIYAYQVRAVNGFQAGAFSTTIRVRA
jgi:hypothetical protein